MPSFSSMTKLRLLLSDRLNGGIIAAVLAYALVFQLLAGSVAGASATQVRVDDRDGAVATPERVHRHHDAGHDLPECCAVTCQIACGFGCGLVTCAGGALLDVAYFDIAARPLLDCFQFRSPRNLGVRREARAPPPLSV